MSKLKSNTSAKFNSIDTSKLISITPDTEFAHTTKSTIQSEIKTKNRVVQLFVSVHISSNVISHVSITHLNNDAITYTHTFDNLGSGAEHVSNASTFVTDSITQYLTDNVDVLLSIFSRKDMLIDIVWAGKYNNVAVLRKTLSSLNSKYNGGVNREESSSMFNKVGVFDSKMSTIFHTVTFSDQYSPHKLSAGAFYKSKIFTNFNTTFKFNNFVDDCNEKGITLLGLEKMAHNKVVNATKTFKPTSKESYDLLTETRNEIVELKADNKALHNEVTTLNNEVLSLVECVTSLQQAKLHQDARLLAMEAELKILRNCK